MNQHIDLPTHRSFYPECSTQQADEHRFVSVSTGGHHATVFVKSHPSFLSSSLRWIDTAACGSSPRAYRGLPLLAHCSAALCSRNIHTNIDVSLYNASDLLKSPVLNRAIVNCMFSAVMNCVVTILLTIMEPGNDDKRFDISTHLLRVSYTRAHSHTRTCNP